MRIHTFAVLQARGTARSRRIAASALLAITLAGNFAAHHHSLLSADYGSTGHGEERVVSRHNPLSRASHWHAVLAFVHEHECVACHNQRLAGLPVQGHEKTPVVTTQESLSISFAIAPAALSLSTASRAPPVLL